MDILVGKTDLLTSPIRRNSSIETSFVPRSDSLLLKNYPDLTHSFLTAKQFFPDFLHFSMLFLHFQEMNMIAMPN